MTKEEKERYEDTEKLREILYEALAGRKFRLDCGHYAENIVMRSLASGVQKYLSDFNRLYLFSLSVTVHNNDASLT